jgi:hypothetical protein
VKSFLKRVVYYFFLLFSLFYRIILLKTLLKLSNRFVQTIFFNFAFGVELANHFCFYKFIAADLINKYFIKLYIIF